MLSTVLYADVAALTHVVHRVHMKSTVLNYSASSLLNDRPSVYSLTYFLVAASHFCLGVSSVCALWTTSRCVE